MVDVWTARVSYRGSDRLDVSRKGGDPIGVLFAPSWALLRPFLEQRRAGIPLTDEGWQRYSDAYTAEMRVSHCCARDTWNEVLARDSVTLLCFCTSANQCHRTILASLFWSLGANLCGERTKEPSTGTLRGIE